MQANRVVQLVYDQVDIVALISKHVKLTLKGKQYWGRCPFHQEKTPSFNVDPDLKKYHCFGCNEHGDVINFYEKIHHLDFKEAIKALAKEYNLSIAPNPHHKTLALLQSAVDWYHANLTDEATKYLLSRGLSKELIVQHKLGYSSDAIKLQEYLLSCGFNQNNMVESGLFMLGKHNLLERFSKRIIFPITDGYNQVLAVAGRIIHEDNKAKYINLEAKPWFNKKSLLFNWANVKLHDTIWVVEGYLDAILLTARNFPAVACMSASLSMEQIQLMKNKSIILAFDGDTAGFNSSLKTAKIMLLFDKVFVANIPLGLDPKDIVDLKSIQLVPCEEFIFNYELQQVEKTNAGFLAFWKALQSYLVPDLHNALHNNSYTNNTRSSSHSNNLNFALNHIWKDRFNKMFWQVKKQESSREKFDKKAATGQYSRHNSTHISGLNLGQNSGQSLGRARRQKEILILAMNNSDILLNGAEQLANLELDPVYHEIRELMLGYLNLITEGASFLSLLTANHREFILQHLGSAHLEAQHLEDLSMHHDNQHNTQDNTQLVQLEASSSLEQEDSFKKWSKLCQLHQTIWRQYGCK